MTLYFTDSSMMIDVVLAFILGVIYLRLYIRHFSQTDDHVNECTIDEEHSDVNKEEGEIEDGEIVDSQNEDNDANDENDQKENLLDAVKINGTETSAYNMFANIDENINDGLLGTGKKKKKKKKKKKRPLGQLLDDEVDAGGGCAEDGPNITGLHPKKRPRYIDHDKVEDEKNQWFDSDMATFPREDDSFDSPNRGSPPPGGFGNSPFGRSPPPLVRRRSRSPPGLYDSPYESSDDQAEPPLQPQQSFGGRFDGGPMGKGYGKRGGRNAGKKKRDFKRGKRGRNNRSQNKKALPSCRFHLDGKCNKGDQCIFKHDGSPPKKPDLCKFYLNGFCAKGENCLYMHNEFPCKFFHTGAKCYLADNCRFSHAPLTDDAKAVLKRYLEKDDDNNSNDASSTKSSRSESQTRHARELAAKEAVKKIPSLFDIQVDMPKNLTMPRHGSPPMQHPDSVGGFYTETMLNSPPMPIRPPLLPTPMGGHVLGVPGFGFNQQQQPFVAPLPMMMASKGDGQMPLDSGMFLPQGPEEDSCPVDNDHVLGSSQNVIGEMDVRMPWMQQREAQNPGGGSAEEQAFHVIPWSTLAIVDVDSQRQNLDSDEDSGEKDKLLMVDVDQKRSSDVEKSFSSDSEPETTRRPECNAAGSSVRIPFHLPKKQRELFLRIQQQQREARNSGRQESDKDGRKQQSSGADGSDVTYDEDSGTEHLAATAKDLGRDEDITYDDDDDDENVKKLPQCEGDSDDETEEKRKWYSSSSDDDDEDQPLTAVLKKLQQQPVDPEHAAPPSTSMAPPPLAPFDIAKMLQSITGQCPSNHTQESEQRATGAVDGSARAPRSLMRNAATPRDPRSSRDPRSKLRAPLLKDPAVVPSPAAVVAANRGTVPDGDKAAAYHPIPYRLHTVTVSHPNYRHVAASLDSKLLANDPRLKKKGADPRLSRGTDRSRRSSRDEEGSADDARPSHHRLGAAIMPAPVHRSLCSPKSTSTGQEASEVVGRVESDEAEAVDVTLRLGPVKKLAGRDTDDSNSRDSNNTPPPAVPKGATMKSYQRKSSMDYASPLGYNDDEDNNKVSGSGYNRRPRLPLNVTAAVATPPPAAAVVELSAEVAALKDIFKTIDPTASPFC